MSVHTDQLKRLACICNRQAAAHVLSVLRSLQVKLPSSHPLLWRLKFCRCAGLRPLGLLLGPAPADAEALREVRFFTPPPAAAAAAAAALDRLALVGC
jgi:hypothetical protein